MTTTYRLRRSGELVTSKNGDSPVIYVNRTQATRAAEKIAGAEVIQRGRPFYVRVPEPLADAIKTILDPAPGIRLTEMKLLCGCRQRRQDDGTWTTIATDPACMTHRGETAP